MLSLYWWRPPCLLRAVIVNMKDDPTAIRGVLWSSRGAWLTFRDCSLLPPTGNPTRIDGEVVLHRDNLAFLQVLP
jgi:hypothetical protein